MAYEITLGNHPSQARHPFTNEPLFDNDGVAVPLFPDQRSVMLDGRVIAYVSESRNVQFIYPVETLTQTVVDDARAHVEMVFGDVGKVTIVKPPVDDPDDDHEEDED